MSTEDPNRDQATAKRKVLGRKPELLSANEMAWLEFLRLVWDNDAPQPTLPLVQAARLAFQHTEAVLACSLRVNDAADDGTSAARETRRHG